jgi:hypothetical protein
MWVLSAFAKTVVAIAPNSCNTTKLSGGESFLLDWFWLHSITVIAQY